MDICIVVVLLCRVVANYTSEDIFSSTWTQISHATTKTVSLIIKTMAAASKEVWLENEIRSLITTLQRNKQDVINYLKQNQNSIKAIFIALGGAATCLKIYKLIQPKPRKIPKDEEEIRKESMRHHSRIDAAFISRLFYLIRIGLPRIASKEFVTIIALFALIICQSLLTNWSNSVAGDLMVELANRNLLPVVQYLVGLMTVLSVNSFITPTINYLIGMLHISMRKNMTMAVHKQYYRNMIYYKAQNLDKRLGNPDQRITQDVDVLCKQITNLFVDFLSPVVDVILYSYQLTKLMGVGGPISIFTYICVAFFALSFVTPNFTRMSAEVQNREGEFRHIHARIRLNAESIAFYGGDEKERTIIEKYFDDLTSYKRIVIKKNFVFGVVNDYFTKYAPYSVMSLVAGLPFFFGEMRYLSPAEVMGTMRYLVSVVAYEFFAVGKLIQLFRKVLKISGYTHRVHLLFEVMSDLETRERKRKLKLTGQMKDADEIRFEDVSIMTPGDIELAKHLSFTVKKGKNVVISGPNGCGKSSLFRVLGGLWPLHEGTVFKPGNAKDGLSKDIFYLPQKAYNVIGSLRDQIIYPSTRSERSDSELRSLLNMFGIGYLSTRHEKGFDGVQDWDKLSRGEQQRLAMVRLFYHRPSYAILDECTSCINNDAETDLYNNCAKYGITCITISHRPALERFHNYRLVFNGAGGWSWEKKVDNVWVKESGYELQQNIRDYSSRGGAGRASQ
jgi:ATP-binding cassette subfamily D (ALD) protein 3